MKLMVILGSVREGRAGEKVANWITGVVGQDNRFELDYVDPRNLDLPFYDEPASPFAMASRNQEYANPAGRAWADRVGSADAFILVTPEYNHGYPAVLKNALDWVGPEWNNKPVGLVGYSYQGVAGARSVEQLRQVVVELGLIQIANSVHIFPAREAFDDNGQPKNPEYAKNLSGLLSNIVETAARYRV